MYHDLVTHCCEVKLYHDLVTHCCEVKLYYDLVTHCCEYEPGNIELKANDVTTPRTHSTVNATPNVQNRSNLLKTSLGYNGRLVKGREISESKIQNGH